MASFEVALPYVLAHEGGWVNDPEDPGGATNKGVIFAVAKAHGIDTIEKLRAITDDQVAAIYRAGYWRFDRIEDQRVATKLLDLAVNMGLRAAVKLSQSALNELGAALVVDGSWGIMTETTVNSVHPDRMLDLLCMAAAAKYRRIVAATPRSNKFLAGWLKRAYEVPRG